MVVSVDIVKPLPAKIPKVIVYLEPRLKKDLERLANKEKRSLSNMVAVIVQEAIDKAKSEGKIDD